MEYRGFTLDRFQQEAVEYIEQDDSVLIAAPTGTGKTLVADYLTEKVIKSGKEIIYTAPVKALSNQKYREYSALLGKNRVGLVTGDLVINREAPLRIMTTEILRNMLLQGRHEGQPGDGEPMSLPPSHLDRLEAVVIDEIHYMDDPSRGTVWEELLIYLPNDIRILGLSATLSNLNELADWLTEIRQTSVRVVREDERAVPLNIQMASRETDIVTPNAYEKAFSKWQRGELDDDDGRRTKHADVIDMLPDSSFPALYFIFSRKMVEKLASALARGKLGHRLGKLAKRDAIEKRIEQFEDKHPDVLTQSAKIMLRKGIGFHHAGVHVSLKAFVEKLYEERLLNVLYCTSTFALGINMPARTVIFDSLTKYNGEEIAPLKIREFMQMAGRAGRRGIDKEGDVVIRQNFDDFEESRPLLHRLMSNESEPITSSFNLSFYSVVNLLERYDTEDIKTLLHRSFKAYRRRQKAQRLERKVDDVQSKLDGQQDQNYEITGDNLQKQRWKRAALKRKLVEARRPQLWENFQKKISFLRAHNYIDEHDALNDPAHILKHIKIEEIFVTELILSGTLEDLEPNRLYGVMCGLVMGLPRRAKVKKPEDDAWWQLFEQINSIFEKDIIANAEKLVNRETTFTPEVMPLAERWAEGEDLQMILDDIDNPTDLSGDLVSGFRRAKDLVGQLLDVYRDDDQKRDALHSVIQRVSRDEVEVLS